MWEPYKAPQPEWRPAYRYRSSSLLAASYRINEDAATGNRGKEMQSPLHSDMEGMGLCSDLLEVSEDRVGVQVIYLLLVVILIWLVVGFILMRKLWK
jgi:hypothetical protein